MSSRKAAPRLAKPAARYWRGKAPKGVADVDSESGSEEENEEDETPQDVPLTGDIGSSDEEGLDIKAIPKESGRGIHVKLKDVNISEAGKVIVGGKEESGRTILEQAEEDASEGEEEEEGVKAPGAAGGESSSEYETDSDEEPAKPALLFRPVFVPKRGRETVVEREAASMNSDEAWKKKEAAVEERKKQSHDLVAESIKRKLAEKETPDLIPDVDDTDGLDPNAEFDAWKLRELARIKRDEEVALRREKEREEIERRRAMPEEQRLKEDLENAQKLREKPKGQQKFLQKYWHKGAFHQDADILKRHDFTEATESTIDKTLLPQVMQVKNFGKRSQTKYTHLLDQDTSVKTDKNGKLAGGNNMTCFHCGGSHLKKECPQLVGTPLSGADGKFGTGSNNNTQMPTRTWGINRPQAQSGEPGKSWKERDEGDSGWRHRDGDRDRGKETVRRSESECDRPSSGNRRRDDDYRAGDRRRPRSRSRSPPRGPSNRLAEDDRRRRRSRSRSREKGDRDKKRRVEAS